MSAIHFAKRVPVPPAAPGGPWLFVHMLVNGTPVYTSDVADVIPDTLDGFLFGAYYSGASNSHYNDNVKVGGTLGGTDVFSCDFSAAIVPPFDSTTGVGLSIVGGELQVSNAGTDAYAEEDGPWASGTYPELYFEFTLRVEDPEWNDARGSYTSDFINILAGGGPWLGLYWEIYNDGSGGVWFWDGPLTGAPSGTIHKSTTYTIVIHFSQT